MRIRSTLYTRLHNAARLCRIGAWIIFGLGLTLFIFLIATNISQLSNQGGQGNGGQDLGSVLVIFALALLAAIPVVFFILLLNAIGAYLDYVAAQQHAQAMQQEQNEKANQERSQEEEEEYERVVEEQSGFLLVKNAWP